MALVEDPYFVTDDPYGGGYEQDEEEDSIMSPPGIGEDPSRQADELAEDAGEEEVPYEEPEEEAENWPEEEVVGVEQPEQPLEEEAWEENVEEEAYLDETNAQVEADLGDEPGEEPWAEEVHEEPLEAEAQEPGFEAQLALGSLGLAALGSTFVAPGNRGAKTSLRSAGSAPAPVTSAASQAAGAASVAGAAVCSAAVLMSQGRKVGACKASITALQAFEQELGVQPPVGYWDPAGLARDGDAEAFKRRRSVELKHGRIAMLATMGYITPEIAGKFPGYLSPSAGLKFADELGVTPPLGFWDPLGFSKFENPEVAKQQFKRRRIVEIQHGRVAMLACIGYIVPEYFRFPGLCSPSQGLAFTDIPNGLKGAAAVPLAGVAGCLGVTPPLGFWDPLGFSKFESPEIAKQQFKRRRIVEIQHGRVAMLACLGYIVPEYFRFPGLCSPSQGLAFTDIPNGLKGAAAVPLAGWLQIITFARRLRRTVARQLAARGDATVAR
eukprot:g13669.t1